MQCYACGASKEKRKGKTACGRVQGRDLGSIGRMRRNKDGTA